MDKKIIFFLHLPPPVHGSSTVGQQLFVSSVIAQQFETRWVNLLASFNVEESGRISIRKIVGSIFLVWETLWHLIWFRPSVAYYALTVSGAAFLRDVIVVGLLKSFGVPIVFHLHNKGVSRSRSRVMRVLYRFVFRGSRVVLLSNRLYSDVEKFVNPEQVRICPNGMDVAGVEVVHARKDNGSPKILFFSNLIEEKGVIVLLEACRLLKDRGVEFECQLVGSEGDVSTADLNTRLIEMDLTSEVKYLGRKYGEEKLEIFAQSDIFVFPTYYRMETFGLVLLEAMAAGLPCVSTAEGGILDLVLDGETGLIVEKQNAEDLADKLETLIADPDMRQRMGVAGRNHYQSHFTAKHFEERMLSILSETFSHSSINEYIII